MGVKRYCGCGCGGVCVAEAGEGLFDDDDAPAAAELAAVVEVAALVLG